MTGLRATVVTSGAVLAAVGDKLLVVLLVSAALVLVVLSSEKLTKRLVSIIWALHGARVPDGKDLDTDS
jgi:predicted membrane chloride channel (bestrophin family)